MWREYSVEIGRPVGEVFARLSEPESALEWSGSVVAVTKLTPGPVGVGSRYRVVGKALGRRLAVTLAITDYQPNRVIAYRRTPEPGTPQFAEGSGSWLFAPIPHGTRFTLRAETRPGLLRWLVEPVVRWQVGRDQRRLKQLIEGGPPEAA
jgi:uncharacterized protein YndB with AHSA1/START domain